MYKIIKILYIYLLFVGLILADNSNNKTVGQPSFKVDEKTKVRQIKELVNNAIKHIEKVSLEEACNDFIYNPIWRKGDLYVFIVDEDGIVLAAGDTSDAIWKNLSNIKLVKNESPLIDKMLKGGKEGKFIGYVFNNGYKSSFVKTIEKNGTKYIVGAGFYPEDNHYLSKQITVNAANYLNHYGSKNAFAYMSSPESDLIKGNIYVVAYDFNGICVANGRDYNFIGQSFIDQKDSRGLEITKKIIEIAKNKGKGFLEYYENGERKIIYILKALDPKTKKPYIITAGYFPGQDLEKIQSYVNRAIAYIKENGAEKAFSEFTNPVSKLALGDLTIYVYDFNGKCLANGADPSFVGRNMINYKDEKGHYFIKEMLKIAKQYGQGTLPIFRKNSGEILYFKSIDVPDGKFIVGSSFFPNSKKQTVESFVGQAKEHLLNLPTSFVFNKFTTPDGIFDCGDLHIFVYNTKGVRLVNGVQKGQVWLNFIKTTDQEGRPIISDLISTALNGGGWLDYKTRNENRKIYVQEVTKKNKAGENETYIIGSGYFV